MAAATEGYARRLLKGMSDNNATESQKAPQGMFMFRNGECVETNRPPLDDLDGIDLLRPTILLTRCSRT